MDRTEALRRLHEITDGIDRAETEKENAWWETSRGAQFGSGTLARLVELVEDLTRDR